MRISDWSSDVCSSDLVDGSLHRGSPDAAALRMLVVGRRRPEALDEAPEAALRRREVYDFGSLWTWTAEVVANRAKVEDFYAGEVEIAGGVVDPDLARNEYQTPYVPPSRIGAATTMVPRNIERSEEHTSELQSLMRISYAVFCLKKKT